MDKIYTKRAFAFVSILVLLISLATNVFAISEQGLPGEIGDMFDGDMNDDTPLPRAGENTTDLPDGDHTTERAPTTTRSPLSTTSPATTGNIADDVADAASMGGAWIILLLVLLAAVIVIIVAVVTKKK